MVTIAPGIVIDVFRKRKLAAGTAATASKGPSAVNWTLGAAADTADLNWTSGGFSVGVWLNQLSNTANNRTYANRLNYVSETTNAGYRLIGRSLDNQWYFEVFNNGAFLATYGLCHGGDCRLTGDQFLFGVSDGTTRAIWQNGVQQATSTFTPVPATNTTVAFQGDGNSVVSEASTYMVCTWNRALSSSEINLFQFNPAALLLYPEDDLFSKLGFPVIAAATPRGDTLLMMGV